MAHFVKNCMNCKKEFTVAKSLLRLKFCSMPCYQMASRGRHPWNYMKSGVQKGYWAGKKRPEISGSNNYQWKEDRTIQLEKHRLRSTLEWKSWRSSVFTRDNFTCIDCGAHGVYVEPHHIIPLKQSLSRAFDITNGITLCRPCHKKTMGKELRLSRTYFSLLPAQV